MIQPLRIFSTKILAPAQSAALRNDARIAYSEADFIRTEFLHPQADLPVLAAESRLVFTSPQAVKAAVARHPGLREEAFRCFCLEGATQYRLLQECPLAQVETTAEAAGPLAERILAAQPAGPVLFFCGDRRRDTLPALLAAAGIRLDERVVYRTVLQPHPVADEPDALLFFSPSAVESFLQRNRIGAGTVCFAIGGTTAAAIREHTGHTAAVASRPAQDAVLDAVFTHFQMKSRVLPQE